MPSFISHTGQHLDLRHLAGAGIIFASVFGAGTAAPAAQYQHGTHAVALYNAQAQSGTGIFNAVSVKQGQPIFAPAITYPQYVDPPPPLISLASLATTPVNRAITSFTAGPLQQDLSLQGSIFRPVTAQSAVGFGAEYKFGTHQKALYDSQNTTAIFPAVRKPPLVSGTTVTQFTVPPQSVDLTLQGFVKTIPLAQGWLLTMITAGPQAADFTLSASLTNAQPFQSLAPALPINPATVVSVAQADPTQIQPAIFKPSPVTAKPQQIPQVFAAPTPWNWTQIQGRIFPPALPGPAKYIQPSFIRVYEQQYDKNQYPLVFNQPYILVPPPPPGFRVTAVTAGWYLNVFRTPGDVFDLIFAADFSDSTIDYQPASSGTVGFGWMARVPQNTPLVNWLEMNNAPYLPPQDPNRRFVY